MGISKNGLTRRRLALLAGLPLSAATPVRAAQWPTRPVRLVLPFAPGGAADLLARGIAQHFSSVSGGQPLLVDNRPGAGGTVAAAHVAAAAPDGYTLLLADIGANAVAAGLFRALPYDPATAFAPVLHLVDIPVALVARADAPFADTAGMLAAARVRMEALTYASAGPGGASHLFMELLGSMAAVKALHVPYRGGSQVVAAVVQGEVDVTITSVTSALPFVRSGAIRALGVGGAGPVALMPGVPPIAAAVAGYEVASWHGVVAPAGTPSDLLDTANRLFNRVLAIPDLRGRLEGVQGFEVVGGQPAAFGALVQAEIARWAPVVRASGIRPE